MGELLYALSIKNDQDQTLSKKERDIQVMNGELNSCHILLEVVREEEKHKKERFDELKESLVKLKAELEKAEREKQSSRTSEIHLTQNNEYGLGRLLKDVFSLALAYLNGNLLLTGFALL
ncbi:uncharacterized protein LOC121868998 [Homarus americanus]|nr:uncharacterized protein LOC121868998 [Homarus americanus]